MRDVVRRQRSRSVRPRLATALGELLKFADQAVTLLALLGKVRLQLRITHDARSVRIAGLAVTTGFNQFLQ